MEKETEEIRVSYSEMYWVNSHLKYKENILKLNPPSKRKLY
jgi:hypothetical protein